MGFNAVEIPIDGMGVIKNGEIDNERLKQYIEILNNTSLAITTHAPLQMNLFNRSDFETELDILHSSLEVTEKIGAMVMTYHPGRFIAEEEFCYIHNKQKFDEEQKLKMIEMENIVMKKLGEIAKSNNVMIGMENLRPYLDYPGYSYAEIPSDLMNQVKNINHSHVGITLDVGHLFMAVKAYNMNFKEQLKSIAPYVIHLHIHDNFGKLSYSLEKNQYDLIPRGRGDMHMPIGCGEVPLREILNELMQYFDGYLIHELRDRYEPDWPYIVKKSNDIISMVNGELKTVNV